MQTLNQKHLVFVFITILLTFGVIGTLYSADLNVGEPRTVRMIYFLPNDWSYRADVVQRMKDEILTVQTFYAEQMQAHGYGSRTFQFEIDTNGEPVVHRVDGKYPFSRYDNTLGDAVIRELEQTFNFDANIYFIVLGTDALRQSDGQPAGGVGHRQGKNGGNAVLSSGFSWKAVAHELGHVFGLVHDFREDTFLMAYGQQDRLSTCAAEFLSVHPYFNSDISIQEERPPTIELISSRTYPAGSESSTIRVKVSDSDGLHQILLYGFSLTMCRGLEGEKDALVEFDYSGSFTIVDFSQGRVGFRSLADNVWHPISVDVVDRDGNVSNMFFRLTEKRENHIDTLAARTDLIGSQEFPPTIDSLAFSPDGTILAAASEDGTVKLWDMRTQREIDNLEDSSWSVAFSPNDTILAFTTTDATVKLWDVATLQEIGALDGQGNSLISLAFSPDGTILAAGSWDRTIKLWDVATRREIGALDGHTAFIGSVAFSPDGTILASGAWDGTIKLWDVATRQEIHTFEEHTEAVSSVAFSPVDMILASTTRDNTIKLWDVATRQEIRTLEKHIFVNSVAFSPDGTILASGAGTGSVKLWDPETGVNVASLASSGSAIFSIAFSPDGRILAGGTFENVIDLWEVASLLPQQLVDDRDKITISEIMVVSNGGQLPQWIELYNTSDTDTVNLKGWKLEIQNRRSTNFNGRINTTLTFKEKVIEPQETLLIISKPGRASNHFRNEQIYNLNTLHPNLQDMVLSEEGFYLKLSNKTDELIDEVGNLDGKRNTNDRPAWDLPKVITKDGVRTSMIRRHVYGLPILGTQVSGWISAVNTNLATSTTTYYGHPDDIGAPGIKSGGALPVTLSRFRAEFTASGVVLKWVTESEVDNAGFNILRSETKNGEFKVINPQLIQGAGTTSERHTYTWTDTTAKPNVVYYYQIEDVSHAGVHKQLATVRMRGNVSAVGKLTTRWADLKLQD